MESDSIMNIVAITIAVIMVVGVLIGVIINQSRKKKSQRPNRGTQQTGNENLSS